MRSFILRAGVLALAGVIFSPLATGAASHRQDKHDKQSKQVVGKKAAQGADKHAASVRKAQIIHASLNTQGKRKGAYQRDA